MGLIFCGILMLKQCLLNLNIGELSELIGANTVEALDNIGISANKSNLVEVILETSGINILNPRENRLIFFQK